MNAKRTKQDIDLECTKCGNRWRYKGMNPFYATCTFCLNKVKVVSKDKLKKFMGL